MPHAPDGLSRGKNRRAPHGFVLVGAALLAATAAFLLIYWPSPADGFIKDDYSWLELAGMKSAADLGKIFSRISGFFRPMVTLSFSLNRLLFGLQPFGYRLTNLLLLVLCAALFQRLARRLGLGRGAALFAALLWLFNHHGILMAVLWVSGRTSLLLCLFSLAAAGAAVRRHWGWAALWSLLAMLAKEEAVLLPFVLAAWAWCLESLPPREFLRQRAPRLWPLALPLPVYFLLRQGTGAFLPWTAPDYYAPVFHPLSLLRNLQEYLDRSATFFMLILLVLALTAWRRPRPGGGDAAIVKLGAIWWVGGFALTVFLPIRSSLYAVFPSLGTALIVARATERVWAASDGAAQRRVLTAAILIPLLLVPVYRGRNQRWLRYTKPALRLGGEFQRCFRSLPPGSWLVLHDSPREPRVLAAIYGTLVQTAARVYSANESLRVWLDPPPNDWQAAGLRPPPQAAFHFHLREGDTLAAAGLSPPAPPGH